MSRQNSAIAAGTSWCVSSRVVLDAGGQGAVGNVPIKRDARGVALEGLAEAGAELVAARLAQWEFARRQQADFRHRKDGALGVDVEGAQGFDFVVEQFDTVRQFRPHREDVDQATAHAVFAGRDHLRDGLIAGEGELAAQFVEIEFVALLEEEGVADQVAGRRHARQRSGGGDDQHFAFAARNGVERCQSFGDQVLMRREAVVGQRFPVRQQMRAQRRREPADLLLQTLGVERARRNDQQDLAWPRQFGDCERVGRAGERGQVEAGARFGCGGGK
jgi:hypothetical protein